MSPTAGSGSKRRASRSPGAERPSKRTTTMSPEEGELPSSTLPPLPASVPAKPKVPFPFKKKNEPIKITTASLEHRDSSATGRNRREEEDDRRSYEQDRRHKSSRPQADHWEPDSSSSSRSRNREQHYRPTSPQSPRSLSRPSRSRSRSVSSRGLHRLPQRVRSLSRTPPRRESRRRDHYDWRNRHSRSRSRDSSRFRYSDTSDRYDRPRDSYRSDAREWTRRDDDGYGGGKRRRRDEDSRHYHQDSYRPASPHRSDEPMTPPRPAAFSPITTKPPAFMPHVPQSPPQAHNSVDMQQPPQPNTIPGTPPPPAVPPPPPPPPDSRLNPDTPQLGPVGLASLPKKPTFRVEPPPPPAPASAIPPAPHKEPHRDRPVKRREVARRTRKQDMEAYGRTFHGCGLQEDYEVTTKLGEGTFGEVHKAVQKSTGRMTALKRILMHNEKEGMPVTALREIKILKALKHPSVVDIIDMFVVRSTEHDPLSVYMVFPYMDHDLAGLLENERVKLQPSHIKLYMKQLLEGTEYMHQNHILHRDMKAANLLIANTGCLMIADFGLARSFDTKGGSDPRSGKERKYTNCVVTRWYRPPELLLGARQYGGEVDMWGIGCVLGEMFTRRPILPGTSDLDQLEKIWQLCGTPTQVEWPNYDLLPGCEGIKRFEQYKRRLKSSFETIGAETCDLLDKLLTCNPRERYTASQALDHDYFWTDPLPADPKSLPSYEASHEYDRRGQRHHQPPPAAPQHQYAPNSFHQPPKNFRNHGHGPPQNYPGTRGNRPAMHMQPSHPGQHGRQNLAGPPIVFGQNYGPRPGGHAQHHSQGSQRMNQNFRPPPGLPARPPPQGPHASQSRPAVQTTGGGGDGLNYGPG